MKTKFCRLAMVALLATMVIQPARGAAFEGRLTAARTQGGENLPLLYTVGTNCLRVEATVEGQPNPVDIFDRDSGRLTLLYPHNRSFVRLPGGGAPATAPARFPADGAVAGVVPGTPPPPAGMPGMPPPPAGLPPGAGPQAAPGAPAIPAMPAMPMMPAPPAETIGLKATGETTNLLGLACAKYELKQRGETMEIWATAALLPFQDYVRRQPHRAGPRRLEEQWGGLLAEQKLFPLLAVLKSDSGAERWRFEVKSVTPEKIRDEDGRLFQPPPDYVEIQPLPF